MSRLFVCLFLILISFAFFDSAFATKKIKCPKERPELCTLEATKLCYWTKCGGKGKETWSNGCIICSDPKVKYYSLGSCS